MSGHNKWSSIKHKKGKADAQRGRAFTKITRELITAAKIGGGDPQGNSRPRPADIRPLFSKNHGNLGETGCVNWMFTRQGSITVPKKGVAEEKLIELAIELGAEDVVNDPEAQEHEVL